MVKKCNAVMIRCLLVSGSAIAHQPPGGPRIDSRPAPNISNDPYDRAVKSLGDAAMSFGEALKSFGDSLKSVGRTHSDDKKKLEEAHENLRAMWIDDHGFFWRREDVEKMAGLVKQIGIMYDA